MVPLSSDTQTQPTPAMRQAIADAIVGDEQRNLDPTSIELTERICALLGKEAALFLPTGTMCNVLAIKTHTRPSDLIFAEANSHILRAESGGLSSYAGVVISPIATQRGVFGVSDLDEEFYKCTQVPQPYAPPLTLLCMEQTHNFSGGSAWMKSEMKEVYEWAKEKGLNVHTDGARLLNAVIATGTPAKEFARYTDSIWLDFTKGLGAPIGAVLAGSASFIEKARRYKHMYGGAMRQAGIAAAGCVYALDHHIERLQEDHDNCRVLASALDQMDMIEVKNPKPDTNILLFKLKHGESKDLLNHMTTQGIDGGMIGDDIRLITHLDVSNEDIKRTIEVIGNYKG